MTLVRFTLVVRHTYVTHVNFRQERDHPFQCQKAHRRREEERAGMLLA